MTTDIDFSDKMFLITKETAEAYLKSKATPGTPAPEPKPGDPKKAGAAPAGTREAKNPATKKNPNSLTFANMAWTGEVPPQKWMKFYTAVLSKFAAGQRPKVETHRPGRSGRRHLQTENRRNQSRALHGTGVIQRQGRVTDPPVT